MWLLEPDLVGNVKPRFLKRLWAGDRPRHYAADGEVFISIFVLIKVFHIGVRLQKVWSDLSLLMMIDWPLAQKSGRW